MATPLVLIIGLTAIITACSENSKNVSRSSFWSNFFNLRPSALAPIKYIDWVESKGNGLLLEKEIGEDYFKLQYQPTPYLVLKEIKRPNISKSVLNEYIKERRGFEYFNLKYFPNPKKKHAVHLKNSKEESLSSDARYLSFEIAKDLQLIDGTDTLACAFSHLEPTYGITPYYSLLLSFEKRGPDFKAKKKLLFNGQKLGLPLIDFVFEERDFKHLPELITSDATKN